MTGLAQPGGSGGPGRDHYSYRHYADRGVAEGFDALRFGGPIGEYLLAWQEQVLLDALEPLEGRTVLDVGTGTGRAAIGLSRSGARVIGVDASDEMLSVAQARLGRAGLSAGFARADALALPMADRSVDAVVCLRLLMHVVDWRRCIAELCRVARHRVVLDFPSARSFAALEAASRRRKARRGQRVEAYQVFRSGQIAEAFEENGLRVVMSRPQFVLPIAAHKAVGSLAATKGVERVLRAAGLLRRFGSPITVVAER